MSFGHHCEQSGYEFDAKNLRLDAPCPIEVKCAGKTWTLLVPAGTQDLVITCGADGLRGATAGGKPLSATLGKKKEHEEDDEEEEEGR
jgi:hypothetical protein